MTARIPILHAGSNPAQRDEIDTRSAALERRIVELRRDLHAHPELGFETHRTAEVVATAVRQLGFDVRTGVGGTGVVAELRGARPGPCLLLRADMDALPIHEETGLPFASQHPGVMHACGHDLHSAALVGAAHVLRDLVDRLSGTVRLVFQPAEETSESGGAAMIADGAAAGADYAIAFHNRPDIPVGFIGYVRGVATASSDEFDVTMTGRAAHASRPHEGIDPILSAVSAISQLHLAAARLVDPSNPCVLSIGAIEGGVTHNIIAERCTFKRTVRCRSSRARDAMEEMVRAVCHAVSSSMRASCEVRYSRGVPSIVNNDKLLDAVLATLRRQFGDDALQARAGQFEAEDFAHFSERVPACQLLIGSGRQGYADYLHNPRYQPDERCLGITTRALVSTTLDLLGANSDNRMETT
jgi:amidohydrolase